ncbi:uncharacterized protein LOC120631095 isoform X2 [Pararge aegeria]|uniref:uncharacterized protein LOC120631095 isoform X2 n=1 Tax=Pararge aegeria TaxID=116150 RepID=UPI0019CF73AD|nr:uncharacterized protein LOC120631095 isoform X2 [Pararge aegeria]
MTLKVLILICLAFSMGNAQENSEPNLTYDERFVHLGPSSIHSIKESRIELQGDEPSRRSETNAYNEPNQRLGTGAYNEPRPNDPFQIPRAENIIPITRNFDDNDDNNLLNNINSPTTVPLRETNYNVIDKHTCDDKESDETMERSGNNIQLQDPTKGFGISNLGKSRVMLMDHPRVCYACSSINDPSCWSPDRKTAVKYCRTDHLSCLTKLYKYKGLSYIIRDCGNTCNQHASVGGPNKYTSCTICHHDLCNSAYHFKISSVAIFMYLIVQSLCIKYLF